MKISFCVCHQFKITQKPFIHDVSKLKILIKFNLCDYKSIIKNNIFF